jgi:serine/threonine-protein kinase
MDRVPEGSDPALGRGDSHSRQPVSAGGDPAPTRTETGGSALPAGFHDRSRIPPVRNWERYEILEYLGGGGMGRVFRARDPQLGRDVALKFIRGDDPALIERFVHEARAQARVDHDRICKVFEVGEVEGHPFIAMQLIEGVPLEVAAREMTLEHKLLAVQQVAEGLHEAHRTGLIHRDIKPSNIMVERGDDGRWRPYLMDFGLAHEPESHGLTITGALIGTPQFMSPEQALGWVRDMDRRSDVYQLGATLYTILAGRPPFTGAMATEVLRQVLEDPPLPLSRSDRGAIPKDVEAIVMKCLRKLPDERYPSARALAEDLGRYLDGEPIEARPTTALYRMKLKALKHRVSVRVGAVALLLLGVLGTWAGFTAWTSARRARLAQSFGQQVERIESLARYSHMVPLHDVRPDRQRIREHMGRIEEHMDSAGRIALGPGHYALGRGHMTLESWNEARHHLEAAWEANYREPEVALALGRVMGALYDEELQQTAQIDSEEVREARRARIREMYLDPAVDYLRLGRDAEMESPALVAGILALYERRYEDALNSARTASASTPWLYEARLLEGGVHRTLAIEQSERGDYENALESYEQAKSAYEEAAKIGQSDPRVYEELCRTSLSMMVMELQGPGGDVTPYFDEGSKACGRALETDPDRVDAMVSTAQLHVRLGQYQQFRKEDPRPALHEALETAERALAIEPSALAHGAMASAFRVLGTFEEERGADPRENLRRATQAFEQFIALRPDDSVFNDLGLVYTQLARYLKGRGEDPSDSLRKSIDAYRKSLERNPVQSAALTNLGSTLFEKGNYEMEHGVDPRESLGEAIESFERAIAVNPKQIAALFNMAKSYDSLANYALGLGEDPRALLEKASDSYRAAVDVSPAGSLYAHLLYTGIGSALDALAHYQWMTGEDPDEAIAKAVAGYDDALSKNPKHFHALGNLGIIRAFQAECALARCQDPHEQVASAVRASRAALELNPAFSSAYDNIAHARALQSRYEIESNVDPGASLREGRAAVNRSRRINPEAASSHFNEGKLLVLDGRWKMMNGGDPSGPFEQALAALKRAIEINPDDAAIHAQVAGLHRWRAEWLVNRGDPRASAEIQLGKETVEHCLSINARDLDAMILNGELLLLEARLASEPSTKDEKAKEAQEVFDAALKLNPNLSCVVGRLAARAKRLAEARS